MFQVFCPPGSQPKPDGVNCYWIQKNSPLQPQNETCKNLGSNQAGDCWDVRQCFVRQFKTDYIRLLEGLVFEKKNFFLVTDKLKKLNFFL